LKYSYCYGSYPLAKFGPGVQARPGSPAGQPRPCRHAHPKIRAQMNTQPYDGSAH
jgi:hypothetical protein